MIFHLCLLFCGLFSSLFADYSRFWIGGQAYYYDLHISDAGNTNDVTATPNPFTGWLGGFIAGYEYRKPASLYAVLDFSYALGTISTHGTGNNSRYVHDEILEARVGYNGVLKHWLISPYTGGGFRWNIQHRRSGELASLTFDYYKIYIPLGLLVNYLPHPAVNVGIDVEWMPDVLSMVSLSSLKGAFWKLERKNNYFVELPCLLTYANRWEFGIIPFWIRFADGDSTAKTESGIDLGLDNQFTNDWGGRISLGVHF
jgi:hypothetical protein